MTDRERHEKIERAFARHGLQLSYIRAYPDRTVSPQWVAVVQDVEVGNTRRYPRSATKLEAAQRAWALFSIERP